LLHFEPAQIVRRADGVEKGGFTICGHSDVPIFMSAPRPDVRWAAQSKRNETPDD
jgi:hypothetical protein